MREEATRFAKLAAEAKTSAPVPGPKPNLGDILAELEVISHLAGLVGAKVTVTLEIEAEIPSGAPDNVVRTVTENSRTLKFTSQGFERE